MAGREHQIDRFLPAFAIIALYLGALMAVGVAGGGMDLGVLRSGYLAAIAWFSLWQALLSTVVSVAGGALVALALNRHRQFWGRRVVVALIGASASLPAITVVFGVVALYGKSGVYGTLATRFGLEPQSWIFGLPGILIAHVTLNLPFAARAFLLALESIPAETLKTAAILDFRSSAYLRHVDGPALRREAPGLALMIALLCFTSFAVILTLGGGPEHSTLEVAIYTALHIEVDFARALTLILAQSALCLLLIVPLLAVSRTNTVTRTQGHLPVRFEASSILTRCFTCAGVLILCLVLLPPLGIVLRYVPDMGSLLTLTVAYALITSIAIALASAALSVGLAVIIGHGISGAKAFMNMIQLAQIMIEKDVMQKMKEVLS